MNLINYIKWAGVGMIIISTSMIGMKYGNELRLQYNELINLKKIIMQFRGELKYSIEPLAQICLSMSGRVKKPYEEFFRDIYEKLVTVETVGFKKTWDECVEKYLGNLGFSQKHISNLKELGNSLGQLDLEMQIKSIDLYLERLELDIEESRNSLNENYKLYRCLGVMSGVLITLIII